jgi:hypothetical protein
VPVLVLGMHRSGTSVLTRLVSLLGLDVGDDDLLMGAMESNPTGHWEVTHLTELNNLLLDHLGGRWSGPPPTDADRQAALARGEWGARARSALGETFEGSGWVWKDPRVCVLLPFWRSVIGDDGLSVVLAVREPIEVARSLGARDGFGTAYGVALWERYHRSALAGIAGLPTCVVPYTELLGDPAGVAERLRRFLPAAGRPPGADDLAEFVDPSQRHHVAGDRAGLAEPVVTLLELTGSHGSSHDAFPVLDLPPETPALQVAFDEHTRLSPYHDLWTGIRPLADEALERREEAARLRAELGRLEATVAVRAWRRLTRRPRPAIAEVRPAPVDGGSGPVPAGDA